MVRQYGNVLVVVIAVIALVLAPAMYITGASTVKASGYPTKTSNHHFQPISKLPNDLGNWLESEDYLNWSTH